MQVIVLAANEKLLFVILDPFFFRFFSFFSFFFFFFLLSPFCSKVGNKSKEVKKSRPSPTRSNSETPDTKKIRLYQKQAL